MAQAEAQTTSNSVLSAREKLYGPGRLLNTTRAAQRMQTSSLIKKGEPYDNDGDLESITALSFRVRSANSLIAWLAMLNVLVATTTEL